MTLKEIVAIIVVLVFVTVVGVAVVFKSVTLLCHTPSSQQMFEFCIVIVVTDKIASRKRKWRIDDF